MTTDDTKCLVTLGLACALAGCQFKPNPLYFPPADLAPPPTLPALADLASPPPAGDLAVADAATSADLLSPSPCTHVSEPFSADAAKRWTLMGDASVDVSVGGLQLTSLGYNVAGSAFYNTPLRPVTFDASFHFRVADGSGADGLAFVVASAAGPSALSPYGNGSVNAGYGLGYLGMNGFAVEIDTFMNVGNGDPNANHVALVRTSDGAHLLTGTPTSLLRSTTARSAHVRMTATHLLVEIDGVAIIDGDLPAGFAPPPGNIYFGFTAAASTLDDRHTVSDLALDVGPAGVCF